MNDETQKDAGYWRRRALSAEVTKRVETPSVLDSEREIEALRARLHAIENSRSWRVTAPLRALTELLSGLRRRSTPPRQAPLAPPGTGVIGERIAILKQYTKEPALTDWLSLLKNRVTDETPK